MDSLNQYAGALSLLFAAVVAVSTVVYAVLTWRLVSETRLMRRAQTTPKVAVFYKNRDEWIGLLDIVIQNIGLGPAYDVHFEIQPLTSGTGTDKLLKELEERHVFSTGLRFFSPGQSYNAFFTNLIEGFEEKMAAQIRIKVSYKDATGAMHADEYVLDFSEIRGLVRVGEPPLLKISKAVEKIAQSFERIGSGNRRIRTDVYTSADRVEEQRQRAEWLEQERAKRATDLAPQQPVGPDRVAETRGPE